MFSGGILDASMSVPAVRRRFDGFDLLCKIVGVIVLAAAVLKAVQLATEPAAEGGAMVNRWLALLEVEWEFFLGLWLLAGVRPRLLWSVALACFAAFSCITFYKAMCGEASCGCFGRLQVNPWYTLVLDMSIVALLLWLRPDLKTPGVVPRARRRMAIMMLVWLCVGIPTASAVASYRPAKMNAQGDILGADRYVALDPETWSGKPLPLLKYIDLGGQLAKGEWTVVLYHHDCPYCRKKMAPDGELAKLLSTKAKTAQVAVVEMPEYAPPGKDIIPGAWPYRRGKLTKLEGKEWFAVTPTIIALRDGKVVAGQQQVPALAVASSPVTTSQAASAPVASVQDKYDFGYVEPDSKHRIMLAVANASETPLSVRQVSSGCECVKAAMVSTTIPAGSPIQVLVDFHAPKENVRYDKPVAIFTSDAHRPNIFVRIQADVGLPLEVKPAAVDLGTLAAGEGGRTDLTVVNRGSKSIRPLYATSTIPGCTVRVPTAAIAAGGQLSLQLMVSTRGLEPRKYSGQVTIHTDAQVQPTVSLQVTFSVAGSQ